MHLKFIITATISILFVLPISAQKSKSEYKVMYSQGFKNDKCLDNFEFSNQEKWLISNDGKSGKALKCTGKGDYNNELGGPSVVAVLKNEAFESFKMELDILQKGKTYGEQDLCLFFGIQNKSNYYYAQLATLADRSHHSIFLIKDDNPKRIGKLYKKGIIWGHNVWNHLTIEYSKEETSLLVYYNEDLIFELNDFEVEAGQVGFGSTTGAFKIDNLKLSAPYSIPVSNSLF